MTVALLLLASKRFSLQYNVTPLDVLTITFV